MAKYAYLSDGMKSGAFHADGSGFIFRGSLKYARSSTGVLTLVGAEIPSGMLTPGGPCYTVNDHLGSVVYEVNASTGTFADGAMYDEWGGREALAGVAPSAVSCRHFTGKEDQGPDFSVPYTDFGARHYSPALRRWLTPDPLSEKYYTSSPYAYCAGDPVNSVDPDGRDPIYAINFWGIPIIIGDDGKENGRSYLVKGSVKQDVRRSTRNGLAYSGSLAESNEVIHIPTGKILDDVVESVDDTNNSGVENGGHVLNGESRATRWDSGPKPRIEENDGAISVVASIVPFIQNGKRVHVDVSNISFTWHVHPNVSLAGGQLGSSNPSEYDYSFLAKMRPFGYTGNPFIIGTNNNSVSFYNERRVIKRISYKNFLLMGGKK